jgi:hypothetical protein
MDEYIKTFPEATQKILIEVRDAIRSVVPKETEETKGFCPNGHSDAQPHSLPLPLFFCHSLSSKEYLGVF